MKLIIIMLYFAFLVLLGGFIWMICLGALSHIFGFEKLAIAFWPSVLVSLIFNILLGRSRSNQ